MSKVYRYLLRTNEDGLTTLDSEMQFIQSYFHMLKTRYGDGLYGWKQKLMIIILSYQFATYLFYKCW